MSRVLTLPTVGTQTAGSILGTMPGIRPILDPGLAVILSKATAWYSARDITSPTQQSLPNRVNSAADPAVIGSTAGEDTNDPAQLPHDGDYVRSDGSASSRWVASESLTNPGYSNAHTVIYDLGPAAYTHTSADTFQCPGGTMRSSGDTGVMVYCTATLVRAFGRDRTGSSYDTGNTAAAPRRFIKAEMRVGEGLFLELSDDGVTWEAVDSDLGNVQGHTDDFNLAYGGVAYSPAVNPWGSAFKSMEVYNDDVLIARIDPGRDGNGLGTFTDPISGLELTFTDGGDLTYVDSPRILFDGTDDFIQLPASDTPTAQGGDSYTAVIRLNRSGAWDGNTEYLFSSDTTLNGIALYTFGSGRINALIGGDGGSAGSNHSDPAPTDAPLVAAVVLGSGTVACYRSDVGLDPASSTGSVGTVSHVAPKIGMRASPLVLPFGPGSLEVVLFDGVSLTEAELDAVSAYLLAGAV